LKEQLKMICPKRIKEKTSEVDKIEKKEREMNEVIKEIEIKIKGERKKKLELNPSSNPFYHKRCEDD